MGSIYYGNTPIDRVDWEKEFQKELAKLKDRIIEIETKEKNSRGTYQYFALKLLRANEALSSPQVTLDEISRDERE